MADVSGGSGKPIDFGDYIGGEEALKIAARSLRSLKTDINALSKTVADDSGRIKAGFDAIRQGIADVQAKAGKLNLFSGEDKAVLAALAQQLGELKKRQEDYKAAQAAQATVQRGLTDTAKQYTSELAKQKDALRAAALANDVEGQKAAAAAIRQTTQETAQLSKALRGANSEFTAAKGSYDALVIENNKLLASLHALGDGVAGNNVQAKKLQEQIFANTQTLKDFDEATNQGYKSTAALTEQLGFSREGLKEFALGLASSALGFQAILAGVQAVFQANVEYSRSIAEVRKTTSLTADEAERLAQSLKELDTPTNLAGLLKIASVGGQLGIAKGDLLEFTKAIDIANQALGNDGFSGGAEEIASSLGRIGQVYRKELGSDIAQNILAIGSAVNQLGADGSATSPFLVDVAQRVGAISSSTGVGLKNVLAYAAVLQETGSTSEVAGTALNRFFSTLTTKTKEAYEIAKLANPALTLKEYRDLINNDFPKAIDVFLKGLRAGGDSTTAQARLLKTLKLQSGEAKNAIVTLAQNTELFAERQATANEQLREATSLAKEAAVNTDTLAGSVDGISNDLKNFTTSGGGSAFLKFLVDFERDALKLTLLPFNLIGDGISYIRNKLNGVKKPQEDFTVAVVSTTKELLKQAGAQQTLLDSYVSLTSVSARSAAQDLEIQRTRAKLIEQFGTAEVEIIQQSINKNKERADSNKAALQSELETYTASVEFSTKAVTAAQERANEQDKKLSKEQLARVKEIAAARIAVPLAGKSSVPELEAAIAATITLTRREEVLANQQRIRANILAALNKLGAAPDPAEKKIDNSIEKDKQKKKSLADVLKAELELQKFRLEQQAKDYDRQADNVANSDEVRVRAVEKAVEARKQIAKLDELEQIHEAELKNEKLINGDKALAVERVMITEQLQAKLKELGMGGLRAIVAIRQAGADQLAEIDKQELENQLKGLETIAADETKSADERQQALVGASAKRIEIIALESNAKRRAAKGDAEVLRKIDLEEAQATADELRKLRNMNADLTNNDLAKLYTGSQLFLEKSRAQGIFTEKQYNREREQLETSYLEKKLANLQKDVTKQKEAAELEVEINKRKNDQKQRDDEEAAEKKKRIVERSIEAVTGLTQADFDFKSAQLSAQAQQEEESYEASLKVAGDNAELKAQIEKKHAKESAIIKRKQAENDRDAALFSVLINLAAAVMRDLKDFPFPFNAALILADGITAGLQTAAILSAPLPTVPAYFKGRADGPRELALVGERGPELVERKATGKFEYAAAAQIVQLEAHDKVHTADVTSQMIAQVGLRHSEAGQPMRVAQAFSHAAEKAREGREAASGNATQEKIAATLEANTAALKKFKPTVVNVHRGSDASIQTSQGLTHYLSQRQFKKS